MGSFRATVTLETLVDKQKETPTPNKKYLSLQRGPIGFEFWNMSKSHRFFGFVYGKVTSELIQCFCDLIALLGTMSWIREGKQDTGAPIWMHALGKLLHLPEQQYWIHALGIMKSVWSPVLPQHEAPWGVCLPLLHSCLPFPSLALCSMWSFCSAQCLVFRNKMSGGFCCRSAPWAHV